jgi:hypothetical protein
MWPVLLMAATFGVVPAACGGDAGKGSEPEPEALVRDLDLAFGRDSVSPSFEDAAPRPAAQPTPGPAAPNPAPAQPAASKPASKPAPKPAPAPVADPPAPRVVTLTVPTGTTFAVHLDNTLATDQNQVGDPFTATLSDPIVDLDGRVLLPVGSKIRGRVTAAEKSNRVGETAVITLAFESVSFDGKSYPLQASVVEANPERKTRTTTAQSAGKVAAGAAAGAIVGQVLGKNTKSTVTGAVVGAAAGTAIALGTADVDAVLPAGSRMVIRLDAPVEVERTVR